MLIFVANRRCFCLFQYVYFYLTLEEAEPDHYSKLQSPSDDIYSEAYYGGAPGKEKAGTLLYEMHV